MHYFGRADLGPPPLVNIGASRSLVQQDGSITHMDDSAAVASIIKDIFSLS
jgi:hypothetical protein